MPMPAARNQPAAVGRPEAKRMPRRTSASLAASRASRGAARAVAQASHSAVKRSAHTFVPPWCDRDRVATANVPRGRRSIQGAGPRTTGGFRKVQLRGRKHK